MLPGIAMSLASRYYSAASHHYFLALHAHTASAVELGRSESIDNSCRPDLSGSVILNAISTTGFRVDLQGLAGAACLFVTMPMHSQVAAMFTTQKGWQCIDVSARQTTLCTPSHNTCRQVLAPYDAEDARGLLKAAIRDPDPVVFLENEILYGEAFPVDDKILGKDFVVPIGKVKVACFLQLSNLTRVSHSAALISCITSKHALGCPAIAEQILSDITFLMIVLAQRLR